MRDGVRGRFWERPLDEWRLVHAVSLFALASLLSWSASRAPGRQWRFDAGLIRDHVLVRSGPYRVVRHPIYALMLCLLPGQTASFQPIRDTTARLACHP